MTASTAGPIAIDAVQAALQLANSDRYAGSVATGPPPRSLAELLSRHAQATLQVSGADQTAWNGQVVEAGEGILGLANWDGTLHLDRECILEPLRQMYDQAGEPQSAAALIRYREALVTMLHEQSHFLGPADATQEAARAAFKEPGSRALEEGVAEAWSHSRLDEYLSTLGIDKVAPGIYRVPVLPSYQAFVPAILVLTSDLDERAGLPAGETLRRLNQQTAEGQCALIVDVLYRTSQLPDYVPPSREPVVRLRLENTLRASLSGLEELEHLPRGLAAARSRSVGHQCIAALNAEITAAEHYFQPEAATQTAERTAATETTQASFQHAFSGLASPDAPVEGRVTAGERAGTGERSGVAGVQLGLIAREYAPRLP